MAKVNIAIIDFKLSNLFSVAHACESVGFEAKITSAPVDLAEADGLILPGVGAFGDAMKNLNSLGLIEPIRKHISSGKPLMGVCLGMQLLFEESDEFGINQGLGIFKGKVTKIPDKINGIKLRVPHIGWDKITIKKESGLFNQVHDGEFMYFVHSYFCKPASRDIIAATTNYEGFEFVSSVSEGNVFAVQFHPEKSGKNGPLLYRNFAKLVSKWITS